MDHQDEQAGLVGEQYYAQVLCFGLDLCSVEMSPGEDLGGC